MRVAIPLVMVLFWSASATASPWTLAPGRLILTTTVDGQYADSEFTSENGHQGYPVDGRFFAANLRLGLRYGVSDAFELGGRLSLSYLHHEADEVYFGPDPADAESLADIRAGIWSFDRQTAGLGDIDLYARYRFTPRGRFVAALELGLKVPTGYVAVTGPFRDTEEPVDDIVPGATLIDDASLGDGQLDITLQLLLGWATPSQWFFRLDAGARARLFGPGQQVVGAFKFGRRVTDWWVPYLVSDGVHSFTDGEVIGQVLFTERVDVDAEAFEADFVTTPDQTADRTVVRVGVGSIFTIDQREVNVGYTTVVWGINTAQMHIVSVGTTFELMSP